MAQDETAVKHKSQCIPAGGRDQTMEPWLAIQRANTRLTSPLTYSHDETTNISKIIYLLTKCTLENVPVQ